MPLELALWPAWVPPLLVAPVAGSFLGVLIVRLPQQRPVALTRSACDHCGTPLAVKDLVPVASYVVQRGRCRYCRADIGPIHLAVELAAIAIAAGAAIAQPDPALLWVDCLLGWSLLALAWIDWQSMLLPDALTLPLLLAGLGVALWRQPDAIAEHAAAAVVAYLSLRGLALAYRWARGREGLGAGDAKLLAAAGAWLGLAALPWVILMAATAGLLAALGWALAGRRIGAYTALPFGPWLALAMWLLWLFHDLSAGGMS